MQQLPRPARTQFNQIRWDPPINVYQLVNTTLLAVTEFLFTGEKRRVTSSNIAILPLVASTLEMGLFQGSWYLYILLG